MSSEGVQDAATVEGFGREWSTFDQSALDESDLRRIFEDYFALFPWADLPQDARGADIGCGSGRWAQFVAPRVGHLLCVDASEEAVAVAKRKLQTLPNAEVRQGMAGALDIEHGSLDFAYSLGVLHHTPDPEAALRDCVDVLKPGAPFLLYIYYAFDNRPAWFRSLWRVTDALRRVISSRPFRQRYWISQAIACVVYWPLARAARMLELVRLPPGAVELVPLAFYRDKPFYVLRNDALDRFGTKVEHRFTQAQMRTLMESAGLTDIEFAETAPFWVAVGRRATA
ncbi:MAG: class I SAM-dependent methyltransferase [Acidimicrobiales bacterium]